MSVANFRITPDVVEVYTDTMVYNGKKPLRLDRRKCAVATSRRFALAGRGNAYWFDEMERILDNLDSADEVESFAPDLLRKIASKLDEAWFNRGSLLSLGVAGWSDRRGGMHAFKVRARREGVSVEEIPPGIHLQPGGGSFELPSTATPAHMIRAAMVQHKLQDRFGIALCIGGVLHRTVITRDGIRQEIAALYPDYDTHAAQLGDPNAEAVAAWLAMPRVGVAA